MKSFINAMRVLKDNKGNKRLLLLWSEYFNKWEIVRRDQFNVLHKKLRLVYHKNYQSKAII